MKRTQKMCLVIVLLGGLVGCRSAVKMGEDQEQANTRTNVGLRCIPIEGATEEDIYRYMVHLVDGNQSTPIMLIPVCSLLDSTQYADHQIPSEAIAAASSWWAGSGDYLYAVSTTDGILLRRAVIDEMQLVRDYGYMDWALWQQDTLIKYDPTKMVPITGLYTAEGEETSYVLLLDRIGEEWQVEAVEIAGRLPAREDLRMELESMRFQKIEGFTLDTATSQFSAGEWGAGELVVEGPSYFMLFKEKKNAAGKPLKLALGIR
ncbi:MAG: hypothetical protein HRU41_13855 [Saprospiraceae bacterium]|nr:hypothetical protein [Saprospiraceae bacterium]